MSLHGESGGYEVTRVFLINIRDKPFNKSNSRKSRKSDKREKIITEYKDVEEDFDSVNTINSLIPEQINLSTDDGFSSSSLI